MKARFRSLRSQFVFPTVRRALAEATRARQDFRVIQFSLQADHLHLLVEATDRNALSRGVQGLAIRIARQVNRLVSRRGKLWSERYFARALTSPRAVRNALAYVLNNFRKHEAGTATLDPFSSAPYFEEFRELAGRASVDAARQVAFPLSPGGVAPPKSAVEIPVVAARTWLGSRGWRSRGAIGFQTLGHRGPSASVGRK